MSRILTRLCESLLILFCIVTINFLLIRLMPGDAVEYIIGEDEYLRLLSTKPEVIEAVRADYGLDRSFAEQFVIYLSKTIRLDFGNSYRTKIPVLQTVSLSLRWTLLLAIPATLLAAFLGGWLGMRVGWNPKKVGDTVAVSFMLLILTVPTNCIAIIFLMVFSFILRIFPLAGVSSGGLSGISKVLDVLWHMALPLIVLTLSKTASNFMLMRNTVVSMRNEEYITVALSKGIGDTKVRRTHLLRNALPPFVTSLCIQFGQILAGSMMIEVVFSWKGMGTLIYSSVTTKDFPMLQTCFLFIGICIVMFNLLADFVNLYLDPRTRRSADV